MTLTKSITVNRPLESVRSHWHHIEGATANDRCVVTFARARAGKETEVRVELLDEEAAGTLGKLLQKAFGTGVAGDVDQARRQFKQIVEVGEITRSDSSIHDSMHAARPADPDEKSLRATPFVSVPSAVRP